MKTTKETKIMLRQDSMGFITFMTISSNVELKTDFTFSPEKLTCKFSDYFKFAQRKILDSERKNCFSFYTDVSVVKDL